MAKIRAWLHLTTSNDLVDFENISNKLQISPTLTRRKSDFPIQSVKAGYAGNEWLYEIRKECDVISTVIDEMQGAFEKNIDILRELCCLYCLEVSVDIIIHTVGGYLPEIILKDNNIKFFSDINADVGFDIYID